MSISDRREKTQSEVYPLDETTLDETKQHLVAQAACIFLS